MDELLKAASLGKLTPKGSSGTGLPAEAAAVADPPEARAEVLCGVHVYRGRAFKLCTVITPASESPLGYPAVHRGYLSRGGYFPYLIFFFFSSYMSALGYLEVGKDMIQKEVHHS